MAAPDETTGGRSTASRTSRGSDATRAVVAAFGLVLLTFAAFALLGSRGDGDAVAGRPTLALDARPGRVPPDDPGGRDRASTTTSTATTPSSTTEIDPGAGRPPVTTTPPAAVDQVLAGTWTLEPRLAADTVVVGEGGALVGIDPTTGAERWRAPACRGLASWSSAVAPLDSTDAPTAAVVECDDGTIAIDATTGEVRWERPTPLFTNRTRVSRDHLVVQSDRDDVTVIDLATGEVVSELWGLGSANAVADRAAIYTSTDLRIAAHDLGASTPRWTIPVGGTGLGAGRGAVYARTNDHELMALDPTSGAVRWTSMRDPGAQQWSDVVGITEHAVVLETTREPHVVTAYDTATGVELWRTEGTDAGSTSDPRLFASAGRTTVAVVSGPEGSLVIHDDRTGEELHRDRGVFGRVTMVDDRAAYLRFEGRRVELVLHAIH